MIIGVDGKGWTKLVAEKSLQKRIIAACGNDCSACPRYVAHPFEKTEEELRHTADLWLRIGYRDHVVTTFEKEKNLSEIRGDFLGDGGYSEDVKVEGKNNGTI